MNNLKKYLALTALCFCVLSVEAATFYVKEGGAGDCTSIENACATVEAAVGHASRLSTDEVRVAGGTYNPLGQICTSEALKISGGYSADFSSRDFVSHETIITAAGDYRVFCFSTGHSEWNIIDGITFTGGGDALPSGGVVHSYSAGAYIEISNVIFRDNIQSSGGAIELNVDGDQLSVSGTLFDNNQANSGSGGAIKAGAGTSVEVDSSLFQNNNASQWGGAIFIESNATSASILSITNTEFETNSANQFGGALLVNGAAADIQISNSSFINNETQTFDGGAIFVFGVQGNSDIPSLELKNTTFVENQASNGNGGVISALNRSNIDIMYSTFINNVAADDGGVIYLSAGSTDGTQSLTIQGSLLVANTASSGLGDNVSVYSAGPATYASGFDLGDNILGVLGDVGVYPEGNVNLSASTSFTVTETLAELVEVQEDDPSKALASYNGGNVRTVMLVKDGPAVDAIVSPSLDDPKDCHGVIDGNPYTDARGLPRPNAINFSDPSQADDARACDIGAFEFNDAYRTDCSKEDGLRPIVDSGNVVVDICSFDMQQGVNQFLDNVIVGKMSFSIFWLGLLPLIRRSRSLFYSFEFYLKAIDRLAFR